MISSTFTDLEDHRTALIKIIKTHGLTDLAMENDSAKPDVDVIESSLRMVRDGAAYIGIIAKKYGQTPPCPKRNPHNVSITELEFNEAVRLKRPILLFLMGKDHLVRESQLEAKAANRKRLSAFRERAKEMGPDTKVHRVYATFGSLDQFKEMAAQSVSDLRIHLETKCGVDAKNSGDFGEGSSRESPHPDPKEISSIDELKYLYSITDLNRRPSLGASIADLDWELMQKYASRADPKALLEALTPEELAPKLRLLADISFGGVSRPHKAAMLCFGRSATAFHHEARSVFTADGAGGTILKSESVTGHLTFQFTRLVELTMSFIGTVPRFRKDGLREDTPEIPPAVIREIISNALVHRDYDLGAHVKVHVRPESVDVFSPGAFSAGALWDQLLERDHSSTPKDPAIALYVTGLMGFEGVGNGFQVFRSYIEQSGRDSMSFEQLPGPKVCIRVFRPTRVGGPLLASARADNGSPELAQPNHIPTPPAFYAEPAYLSSHDFVGRRDQLETLNEWVQPADSHPVLLFEAIGGSGKSMLTWEWVRNHAATARQDWAGRFWYSFYERGAIMADFCQRALAYITGQPLEELRKKKTAELAPLLLHQLQARPWLLILDGLERVLVAYHRIDAAQLRDEEAGKTDEIAQRDVGAAIRPEDDELLRALAGAAPSKLLLTSRLIPRVLLNKASQSIPGVQRVPLPGLRPADAEALFRACGVTGDSTAIQAYLKKHCDCHPLTIGVLVGLVNDYLPDRGNFDLWSADPEGGGRLNLGDLDLVQKRNHILHAAMAALSSESRQLLSMVALLSEAVNYETLKALNPHLPPEIGDVPVPEKPGEGWYWQHMSDEEKAKAREDYPVALQRRGENEQAVQERLRSPEYLAAPKRLAQTIKDLENRGLLQYDVQAKRYDLHPVVRGVAVGGLAQTEKETYGRRVVDHFSSRPHNPYEQAETIEDVRDSLHVVRTLVQMGRFQEAYDYYRGELSNALFFNLEANAEVVALLRPFFPDGWGTLPQQLATRAAAYLANCAALALDALGQRRAGQAAYGSALAADLELKDWRNVRLNLMNISVSLANQGRFAKEDFCLRLALDTASLLGDNETLFRARLDRFAQLTRVGQWAEAEALWQKLDPMGRDWNRAVYRPGGAETLYARARFWQGNLRGKQLAQAEHLARDGRDRQAIRSLHGLRGIWQLDHGQWELAAESLHEAVGMARGVGQTDATAETQLALAKLRLGSLADPRHEAEQLARLKDPAHLALAELWLAIGDRERAKKHAIAAYRWAWADGEPFVRRYELNKSRALLEQLGVKIPNLPPYDPTKDEKLPWEDVVAAAIEELRAEKAAEADGRVQTPTENP
jgi:hypothetical protein